MDTKEKRQQLLEAIADLERQAATTKRAAHRATFLASAEHLREEINELPTDKEQLPCQ